VSWCDSLEENGFAILPSVVGPADIKYLEKTLASPLLTRSSAGVRHALRHPGITEFARHPELLSIAQAIVGSGAFPFRATLFEKGVRANWLVVWHQDTALPLRERRDVPGWGPWSVKQGIEYAHAPAGALCSILALRIHLDESTIDNGPLRVIPKTHALGVLDDPAIQEIVTKRPHTECVVAKGGLLAMRPLILHSSSKSRTQAPRRVLHIEYSGSKYIGDGLELAIA
jgi:ectoine hydroxylase-related dioxygenase (phytanoyl-CoA dioxygenase family)